MSNIENRITEVLLERPVGFTVKDRHFYLYPVTIGKAQLVSQLIKQIGFNANIAIINLHMEMIRLYNAHKRECCTLIAYHTLKGKKVFDNAKVKETADYLEENAEMSDMILLLEIVLNNKDTKDIEKYFKIDEENKEYKRITELKDNKNTLSFGGKSVWGAMIGTLAEKYGWTLDYILWGISIDNINLILADSVKTLYLTDEEIKKIKPKNASNVIKADDPNNKDLILSMNWD